MNFLVGRHDGRRPPCDRRMREYVSCEGLCAECCTGGSVCANHAGAMPRGQLRPFRKMYFEYRYADKVQRNDRQLCPPDFERAFRHLTRLQRCRQADTIVLRVWVCQHETNRNLKGEETMNIEKIEKNGTICAVIRSDEIVITDAQSALDR